MPRQNKNINAQKPQSKDTVSENTKVQEPSEKQIKALQNHIFVGKKPVMSYAMSALIQLAQSGEIIIKARGMVISRAVDVAQIITKRLGNNAYDVKDIVIDSERLGVGEEARNVSTIKIIIGRK